MLKSRRQKVMTWMTIIVMLFGVIAPSSTAWAQTPTIVDAPVEVIGNEGEIGVEPNDSTPTPEDPTATPEAPTPTPPVENGDEEPLDGESGILDTPIDIEATVEVIVGGDGGVIDSDAVITVTVTLPSIPVIGDGGDDYFEYNDSVTLLISENFMFDPSTLPFYQELFYEGVKVGTVEYSNNIDDQAIAIIVFDGDPSIFDPLQLPIGEPAYSGVSAEFTFNLVWNGTHEDDDDGEEYVVILDKTYDLQLPGDVLTYTVAKDMASINYAEGTITWTVTITGESDTDPVTPLNLAGFLFSDDLTAVGTYVDDSFTVSRSGVLIPLATPTITGSALTYTLPDPSVSPVVITFKTSIPDSTLTNGGTISNTAEVFDGEEEIGVDDASAVIVGPSASKTGVADDGFGEGTYDPTDRTITWTIEVDNKGQTLKELTITDVLQGGLTFESAVWERWVDPSWVPVEGKSWTSEPTDGIYAIGDVDYLGRLVILSNVPDEDENGSVASKTYNNQASASWESPGGSTGNAGTDNPGVGIGYDAITKTGSQTEADKANHQISWTIDVNLRGQTPTDTTGFVYYDLFVHDAATTDAALTATANWPSGLLIEATGVSGVTRNNGQKFVGVTSSDSHLTVEAIDLAGLGTLVKVTGLQANGTNQVVLKSQVIDPNILAGNNPGQEVFNTASLFKGTTYRGKASDKVPFANMILDKEMLKRVEVANDHNPLATINPNNNTTGLSNGFHYDYKEVIFRLNINGDGLNFAGVDTNLPEGFGDVTVTDTLPAGWEFASFVDVENAKFLIYNATYNATDGYVATGSPLDPSTISGFAATIVNSNPVSGSTATFTFTNLNQPYVILVKAGPTDETFDGYLLGANSHTETNRLNLHTKNWEPGKTVTQDVKIETQIIGKGVDSSSAKDNDILTWLVDYTPFDPSADSPITTTTDLHILDTLPEGIDLRLNSSGEIIWGPDDNRNITVFELIPNANGDGGYTEGGELSQAAIAAAVSYDNETRTLKFVIPNNTKAYRLVYITDITNQFPIGTEVKNNASLVGVTGDGTSTSTGFGVTSQHGSAIMERSGFIYLMKTDGAGNLLPGVEFTLYNTNADGTVNLDSPKAFRVVGADGIIRIFGLSEGTYILIETKGKDGYHNPSQQYKVVVDENHITNIFDGDKDLSTQSPVEIANYQISDNPGNLTISKTVAGNAGDPTKLFTFTIAFDFGQVPSVLDVYPYDGNGVPNGVISKSGGQIELADGQSITIVGLPAGTMYTVSEADYSTDGYVTTSDGEADVITLGETMEAAFTNTRNIGSLTISKTVAGNGGDHSKLFAFTVTFGNVLDPNAAYPYYDADDNLLGTIKSGATIYLTHGQSVTIKDLPDGATYIVEEADYSGDGYRLTHVSGEDGTIDRDLGQIALFTNTREVGELIIKKTVTGDLGDRNRYFTFVVEFFNDNNRTYQYHGSKFGSIKSGESILLKHDEYVVIEDILVGTHFKVTEVEAHQHGYGTSFTGTEGVMDTAGNTAAFVNWRSSVPNTGDDSTATIGKLGLMVSIPLLLLSSGVYGVLEAKKRKKNLS